MGEIPRIGSVMVKFPHTIDAEASLAAAQSVMEQHDIRHLPVTDRGKLVGIVSDRDIKRSLDPVVGTPPMRTVADLMITDPYVVEPDEPLDAVLLTLAESRIGCALVTDKGKLIGIFTTTDATRMLGEHFRGQRSD